MTDAIGRQIKVATLIWMVSNLASRLAGLFREMIMARIAGATGQTDVYFAAFTLPDFINYLLAGGALSVTFIPILAAILLKGDEEEGWRVFSTVMTLVGGALIVLLSIAFIFAEPLTRLIAPGFSPEKEALLVRYTRILLPAQVFFFAGGLLGAVQMARGRHLFYALSGLVYNAGIIAGGLLMGPSLGMEGFCWGALAGAALGHGVLQPLGASRVGLKFRPNFHLEHPAIRQYLLLTLPFMLGQSIAMTDDWLIRFFGSYLPDASISWLNYAKRLALVLPAVLGQASAAAAFPVLSRQAESKAIPEMAETLGSALKRSLLLAGLGAALLMVLSREATVLAFGRGRFTETSALVTGQALSILALAVPAWVASAILPRGYLAFKDAWTPAIMGTLVTFAAIPVYSILTRVFESENGGGYMGLAAASALAAIAYAVALYIGLARRIRRLDPRARLLSTSFILKAAGTVTLVLFVSLAVWIILRKYVWSDWSAVQCLIRALFVTSAGLGVALYPVKKLLGWRARPS